MTPEEKAKEAKRMLLEPPPEPETWAAVGETFARAARDLGRAMAEALDKAVMEALQGGIKQSGVNTPATQARKMLR